MFVTTKCFDLEYQEFAGPGDCESLNCDGRPCAKCHKCRDWQFTGDRDTWEWIANYKNWKDEDWKRYNGGIYKSFKKRDGATCDVDPVVGYYPGYVVVDGHPLHVGVCLCEDNVLN